MNKQYMKGELFDKVVLTLLCQDQTGNTYGLFKEQRQKKDVFTVRMDSGIDNL